MFVEISPWTFVVNALYSVKDKEPLSLNPQDKEYFWKYTLKASEKIKSELKNICIYVDRYNLENVLWNDNLFINIENSKLSIAEELNINEVNEYFTPSIRRKLKKIFIEAYAEL